MIILCSCSCPGSSCHDVPINLQQDNCYSVLQLYMNEKCYTFKGQGGQSLEDGLSCSFQVTGNTVLRRCRASMIRRRQQSAKVRAKGIDPIQNQVCSSLLNND